MARLKKLWQFGLSGARSVTQRSPLIVGELVLAIFNHEQRGFRGCLVALDRDTGEPRWQFQQDHFLNQAVITASGDILLTCFDGSAHRLDVDGNHHWQTQVTTNNVFVGCVVGDNWCYAEIGGGAQYTYAVNIADGSLAWRYDNGGHAYSLAAIDDSMLVHSNSVSLSFADSRFYLHGIDSASGACRWRTPYPRALFKPLLVDDLIYIGSHGHIALFSAISGELLATFRLADEADSVQLTPLLTDAGVVCVSNNGEVLCVRAKAVKSPFHAGREWLLERQWQQRLAVAVKAAPQLNASGDMLLIAEDGRLLSLTTNDGLLIGEHKLPQFKTGYGFACDSDELIVASSRHCIRLAQ